MASSYYTYDDEWDYFDPSVEVYEDAYYSSTGALPAHILLLMLAVLMALGMIVGLTLLVNGNLNRIEFAPAAPVTTQTSTQENSEDTAVPLPPSSTLVDPASFTTIYDDYILTQGPHGFSYGHMAIDIAAGNGAAIKSPIQGVVTERFVDPIGNPTLVLENEAYRVTFLHGNYAVTLGEQIQPGQIIGTESNKGNTRDMQGRSCQNRDCGYHTHLNVFDKRLGQNVNPLELLEN